MPLAPCSLASSVSLSICARESEPPPGARTARTTPPPSTAPRNTLNSLAANTRRHLGDLEAVAQVGLVRAVEQHGVVVGQPRQRQLGRRLPHAAEDRRHEPLEQLADLGDAEERRLDVDLRVLRLAVGAQVLVAEAARELVVAVHAGDHEDLLEHLRRLRQRVEMVRLQARGHEEVPRALRRRAREVGRLDLEETVLVEEGARGLDGLVPQPHVGQHGRAAQVEIAVLETQRLVDRQRPPRSRSRRAASWRGSGSRPAATRTSTSPLGRFGLTVSGERATTSPRAASTYSGRTCSASACASATRDGSKTSCTTPLRSRRSMKMRLPWSRRRATQPARRTSRPTSAARSSPG